MWKNRNVWILLLGELIAGLGLWMGIIGNLEFMQAKIPSDFMKSIILAIGIVIGVALGPLAGKLTDQLHKKKVMLAAGLLRTISVLFMLLALATDSIGWMIVFLILIQISAAFYFPALQATLPLVVDEKELLQLNGVYMNVSTLSRILGTALGGALLMIMPLHTLYLFSFAAYLALFLLTMLLKVDDDSVSKVGEHVKEKRDFSTLFPMIKQEPIVSITLIMLLIPLLFIGGFNLIVINISELQDSAAIKGWIYTAEGIAFMLGAFTVKQLTKYISQVQILFVFSLFVGVSQLMLYMATNSLITIIAFTIFGFAIGCFFPVAATIFQTTVPKDFHGRFFSFRNMLERIVFQVVLLTTGFLLDSIGFQLMTVAFGMVSVGLTTLFYIWYRQTRQRVTLNKKKALS
ncbi:MFS transporter [Priestia flexa]|uniref:Macrolide transporter n=2 Tax=Priestia TaxID=2800373 RepID=A0A0V8JHG1_9BACI|nr:MULTISPECIES: MFS transporter [Bacillaceae]KSU86470.1 macrolide transporter [Priestia veravalensis]KZB90555.1 macrolide transporter [Bacillus sp. VT 712]MBY6087981.1 MFS transporter [Priestia flexa]MCA1202949.1 MFS transporter [Priestia flexa]MCG7314238.1 MFS transporter [Priestia flexa]